MPSSQKVALDPTNEAIDDLMASVGRVRETAGLPGFLAFALGFLSSSLPVKIPRWAPLVFQKVSFHAVVGFLYLLAVVAHLIVLFDPTVTFSSGLPAIWDLTKPVDMTL